MSFCAKCGSSNEDTASYCTACGEPIAASAASRVVPGGGYVPSLPEQQVLDPAIAGLPGARFIGQWNWGAAFLTPYWLMTHRRAKLGIAYLILSLVPIVNLFTIVAWIYFGLNGTKIAVNCGRFQSEETFIAVENAWRNWAIALTILGIIVGIVYTAVIIATGGERTHV